MHSNCNAAIQGTTFVFVIDTLQLLCIIWWSRNVLCWNMEVKRWSGNSHPLLWTLENRSDYYLSMGTKNAFAPSQFWRKRRPASSILTIAKTPAKNGLEHGAFGFSRFGRKSVYIRTLKLWKFWPFLFGVTLRYVDGDFRSLPEQLNLKVWYGWKALAQRYISTSKYLPISIYLHLDWTIECCENEYARSSSSLNQLLRHFPWSYRPENFHNYFPNLELKRSQNSAL